MTHAACMDNTYHQLHRCTQTRSPSSFSHLKPKHTNWNITNACTHTSPHLYANSASEHEQATESLGKKQGRLPLSLLLHPSSFSSEHFSLSIFSPIRDPHTHLSWHWCTHMHKHTYDTHIFLCPNPCTIPPHPQPLLPSVPPVGCQQLAEAVAMETGPICTLSPWHPPLQEHRDRERENKKMQESELEDTRVRQKEIKRRKKKTKQNTKGEKQRTCTKNGFCSQSITQSHYFYGLLMASYLLTHSLICWLKMNADWKRVDWAQLPRAKMKVDLICSWTLLKSTGLGKYKRIQQCLFLCVCSGTYSSVYIHLPISTSEVEDSQKILPPSRFITITWFTTNQISRNRLTFVKVNVKC